jgi:molybdenum cofactor cytidylyltransferase
MRLANVPIEQSVGGILVHNIADSEGHKALMKGHQLTLADLGKLRSLGKSEVYVALLEPGDVRENEAVARIGRAVAGENTRATQASGGRVNLLAAARGVINLSTVALTRLNSIDGVTVATLPAHTVVEPKAMLATIKTIGLAIPEGALQQVEAIAREYGAAIWVRALASASVAVILTGSADARRPVQDTFTEPIRSRVEELGGHIISSVYIKEDAAVIAEAVSRATASGANCIILAGETSIMDADDITPRGIKAAGGAIEVYGAPVEPGNLLLLGYIGQVPIIGAPGCVKSRDTNVVDLILPRLLSGERVSRADVIALANGGLLV